MIKKCGCRTGSNLVKSSGHQKIVGVYQRSTAVQFQDNLYGQRMRIHTPLDNNSGMKYRCTICGKEK